MSELVKRALFGSLYIALVLSALLSNSLYPYYIVFSIFIFIGIDEYSRLVKNNDTRPLRNILDAWAAIYLFWFISVLSLEGRKDLVYFTPYLFYLMYVIVRSIYSEKDGLPNSIGKTIFGQLYIGGGLSMANLLVMNGDDMSFNRMMLLMIFVCIWANDTGAYIVGSSFGRRKLFPSISPNKSWEGFIGGLAFSMLTAVLFGVFILVDIKEHAYSLPALALIGLLISVSATWGDLFESSLKRNAGVKDSGKILPGHGGILDRIDSLLFALPIGVLFMEIIKNINA